MILQTTISRGLQTLRNDSRYIDQLFRNLDRKSLDQIREFIRKNTIDLCLNYPRTTLKVPAIVILLKSENETVSYLGDSMGVGVPDDFAYDGGIEDEILGGSGSVSSLSGEGSIVFGPFKALRGTNNTLTIQSKEWIIDNYKGHDFKVHIVAGTGRGQVRGVVSNSQTVLMVSPNWNVAPDNTSVFEIRRTMSETLGEPNYLYDRRDVTKFIERRGAMYQTQYQIQVIGHNQEATIFLFAILKAIFFLSKIFMEQQGIINLKMSGTDFLPRTEYQPDYAYMRALNLDFLHPFDVFAELGDIAQTFVTTLETNDAGTITENFTTDGVLINEEVTVEGP